MAMTDVAAADAGAAGAARGEACGRDGIGTIDALQALRAAAAMLVVVDHALVAASDAGLVAATVRPAAYHTGFLGVWLFFAISGAVMMLSHGDDFGRAGAPAAFLARRIGRIVPLYWIVTLLAAAMRPEAAGAGTVPLSLLFVPHQAAGGPYGWPVFPLGWTLQYEMFFYALFAAALFLPRRAGTALLAATLLTLAAASSSGLLGRDNPAAYLGHPVLLFFLAGMAIGLARRRLGGARRLGFGPALAFAGAVLGAGVAAAFLLGPGHVAAWLLAGAAPVLAAAACALSGQGGSLSMPRRAARLLGDATYSIYLGHALIVFPLGAIAARSAIPVPLPLFLALAVALSAAAGIATYRLVERPLVRRLGALLGQRPGIGGRPV